ncbi:MAG: LapA family protein [Deferribacteraceae bacterium]|jgi:uncharacterized integral membrane protein|nr:LapA family protein [Deferribacteraceae bacterium]
MKYIISAIKLIVIVAAVLFAMFNKDTVTITIIPDRLIFETYMFIPILIGLLAGGLVMSLFMVRDHMRMSRSMKIMRKKLKENEDELNKLHNLPLLQENKE